MKGNCETCKWWCKNFPEKENWGWCHMASVEPGIVPVHKETLAHAWGSGFSACLDTHCTFAVGREGGLR